MFSFYCFFHFSSLLWFCNVNGWFNATKTSKTLFFYALKKTFVINYRVIQETRCKRVYKHTKLVLSSVIILEEYVKTKFRNFDILVCFIYNIWWRYLLSLCIMTTFNQTNVIVRHNDHLLSIINPKAKLHCIFDAC